jgi:regulator of sigma E protease
MLEHLFGIPFNLASFVVCLSVVVFVHEFGHFLIARRNGVKCESFSIGFGPELFGLTDRHGTRWKVSLVPLGGYVRMYGESDSMHAVEGGADGTETEQRPMTEDESAQSLKSKTVGQRAGIVFAGPAANFVFAIVVLTCIFMTYGRPVIDPVIGAVNADSAAAEAGLQPGDRFVDIDGTPIKRFEDIQRLVQLGYGETMQVTVNRDGSTVQLSVTPRIVDRPDAFGNVQKTALLGISAGEARTMEHLGPSGALVAAVKQTYEVVEATGVAVGQMISGRRGTEDLGGPIRIYKYSGQAAKTGFAGFVVFMAILSINLGLINLVPVPLLDGGHLLFYAIEAVRGRPLSDRAQEWGFRIGLALVGALTVFVTWNDIVQTWLRGPSASG